MRELRKRTLAKTVVFRVLATLITVVLVYIFTGKVILSLGVGGLEAILKIFLYYIHERAWNKIEWGQTKTKKAH